MESARRSGANQPVEGQAAQWEVLLQLLTPKLLRGLRAEALRLRYLEGMTVPEIARFLGVPVGTVTSRCRRGLCHLRALLAPDCENGAFPAEKDD